MSRKTFASLAVATALAATATGAIPAHARPAADPVPTSAGSQAPTQITVTRSAGFAWPEALLGVGVGGVLLTTACGATSLRRRPRSTVPAPRPTSR